MQSLPKSRNIELMGYEGYVHNSAIQYSSNVVLSKGTLRSNDFMYTEILDI